MADGRLCHPARALLCSGLETPSTSCLSMVTGPGLSRHASWLAASEGSVPMVGSFRGSVPQGWQLRGPGLHPGGSRVPRTPPALTHHLDGVRW